MPDERARTYSGKCTRGLERFDIKTRDVLLSNSKMAILHTDELSRRLGGRIQRSIDELRMIREGGRFQSEAVKISPCKSHTL